MKKTPSSKNFNSSTLCKGRRIVGRDLYIPQRVSSDGVNFIKSIRLINQPSFSPLRDGAFTGNQSRNQSTLVTPVHKQLKTESKTPELASYLHGRRQIEQQRQERLSSFKVRKRQLATPEKVFQNATLKSLPSMSLNKFKLPQLNYELSPPSVTNQQAIYNGSLQRQTNQIKPLADNIRDSYPIFPTIDKRQKSKDISKQNQNNSIVNLEEARSVELTKDQSKAAQELKVKSASFTSLKGQSSQHKKVNQDSLVIKKDLSDSEGVWLLAVADGHGTNGHLVSQFIKKQLVKKFEFEDKRTMKKEYSQMGFTSVFQMEGVDQRDYRVTLKQILRRTFVGLDNQLKTLNHFDIELSGSTLVVTIVSPTSIVVANCGDSRAIVIGRDGEKLFESSDQKPERLDERKRIESKQKGIVRRAPDFIKNEPVSGPYRVWGRGVELPGLAMSRSIGDSYSKTMGVIADPEVRFVDFLQQDQLPASVVLASDGIWDMLKTSYVVSEVNRDLQNCKQSKEVSDSLVQQAAQKWREQPYNQHGKGTSFDIDDVTCIVAFLNY